MPVTRFDAKAQTGVSRKPPPTPPEYDAWKAAPGPATLTPLVTSLEPAIQGALRSYGLQDDPMMHNVALLHVGKALQSYDPAKGAGLDTFVRQELQRLQRINAQRRAPIPIPEGAMADIKHLDAQEQELEYELGRSPTAPELADRTGISLRRIKALRSKYHPVVTDLSGEQAGDDDSVFMLPAQRFDADAFARNMAYQDADAVDRKIMEWSFGLYGSPVLTKSKIAAKLGISVPAITKRAANIAARIDAFREASVL